MGVPGGANDLTTLMAMVNNVPTSWTFSAFSIGRMPGCMWRPLSLAGGNVRVGLEDNIYLQKGRARPPTAISSSGRPPFFPI